MIARLTRPTRDGGWKRRVFTLVFLFLLIEFLDEFVFGMSEAAWPLIREEFALTYVQIGLIQTIPRWVGNIAEPLLGILGDVWRRRVIMVIGGLCFGVSLFGMIASRSFLPLLFSFILFNPSSGAFVSLSQATLMDSDTKRHEHNMARWTLAGSLGMVAGTLLLSVLLSLGLDWRSPFVFALILTIFCVTWLSRITMPRATPDSDDDSDSDEAPSVIGGLRAAWAALRRGNVVRWLILLQFSNLMLDVLHGYLALYFVDVVGVDPEQGGTAVLVWIGVGLISDALLIPLLERVRGLSYLRVSVIIEMILFPAFLIVPGLVPKLIILAAMGFFNAGWYSIMEGRLYSEMIGQSGTVITIGSVFQMVGDMSPFIIGWVAERAGLQTALWLCMLGPIALWIGIPREREEG